GRHVFKLALAALYALVVERLSVDLLLELHDAPEQRIRARRAARDVDVDRQEVVDPWHRAIGALKGATRDGAGAHGDHVFRVGHLVVDAAYGWRHFRGHGAGDDHEVGLAGRGAELLGAEAGDVEAGGANRDHLDGA